MAAVIAKKYVDMKFYDKLINLLSFVLCALGLVTLQFCFLLKEIYTQFNNHVFRKKIGLTYTKNIKTD